MNGGIYWLASYPKSGNTWLRIFIENLLRDADCPADINQLSIGNAASRAWLDDILGFTTSDLTDDEASVLRAPAHSWHVQQHKSPTYFKIHDCYNTLAETAEPVVGYAGTRGCLYVLRNPLDVVPSLANHHNVDLDTAISFITNPHRHIGQSRLKLRPQLRQHLSCWSGHVCSWVDGMKERCHVVRYEDLLEAPLETFTQAARFLQLPDSPERVSKAIRFSAFDELARQEAQSGFRERLAPGTRFFNKGRSGQGRQRLSADQIQRIISAHGAVMERFGYLNDEY